MSNVRAQSSLWGILDPECALVWAQAWPQCRPSAGDSDLGKGLGGPLDYRRFGMILHWDWSLSERWGEVGREKRRMLQTKAWAEGGGAVSRSPPAWLSEAPSGERAGLHSCTQGVLWAWKALPRALRTWGVILGAAGGAQGRLSLGTMASGPQLRTPPLQQERGKKTPMGTPRHRLCNVFIRVFSVVSISEASGLTTGNQNLSFEVSAWSAAEGLLPWLILPRCDSRPPGNVIYSCFLYFSSNREDWESVGELEVSFLLQRCLSQAGRFHVYPSCVSLTRVRGESRLRLFGL